MTVDINELCTLMADEFGVDPDVITTTTTSAMVPEWDSLAHLRLCLAIEQHFGVAIPMDRVGDLDSVAKIGEFLARTD